jgi:hypothetical protein
MPNFQIEGGPEPLGISIKETANRTGESTWKVKEKLRNGTYKAKKSGRRTVVIYQSVKSAWENLPDARFSPPKPRRRAATVNLTT